MKRTPVIYFLFFLSGITALIYEIIWTRMLTLVFGHTVYSVSIVLAAFMAGLGFGSYLWGHLIDNASSSQGENSSESAPQSLLIYGSIEIVIGVCGAVFSLLFANFSSIYSLLHLALPDSQLVFNGIKAILAFGLMFIPTTLMGATLPVISKYYVTQDKDLENQVGSLYFLNTLGAAVGCLTTGFVLIEAIGVLQTAWFAAILNLFIGIGAIRTYQETHPGKAQWFYIPKIKIPKFELHRDESFWVLASFVCGFTALAYEVLWSRLLVFSISSTVYSFSMMLAVFLLGIALGSLIAVPLMRWVKDLRSLLVWVQIGIGFYIIVSLYSMESLLSPPWNSYNLQNPARAFGIYFKDSLMLMLIPTILLGINFPVLIKNAAGHFDRIGRGTGKVYGSNTLGAILGSLVAGFLLLPLIGVCWSLLLVATLNFALGGVLLFQSNQFNPSLRKMLAGALGIVIIAINIGVPKDLLNPFFMRDSSGKRSLKKLLFFEEGITDTVAIFEDNYGILDPSAKRLITNGVSMSASNLVASRYMKLFAHVPIMLSDQPDEVLVICFGTGQTTGAAGIQPRVKSVDSLELSPSVINGAGVFKNENHDVVNLEKVHIVLQDGRNHLLTTSKQYDVITGEPPPPRTAFTVNLYTRDFYRQVHNRLKPGGKFVQWIPLHSQSLEEVEMHLKTFLAEFPHALGWMSVANEVLLLGSDQPIELDFKKLKKQFEDPVVRKAMADIHINSPHAFLANLWYLEDQITAFAAGAKEITDNRPYIEFYLNFPDVINSSDMEQLVLSRASFDAITKRVTNLSGEDKKRFKAHYEAMDKYQKGVLYNNRHQLLDAISMVEDNNLFRYHLQAETGQIHRLEEQLKQDPNNPDLMLNLGHANFQIGNHEKSMELLQKVLEKNPKQSYANLYMAFNLMEVDRTAEAKPYFEAAVKVDPSQLRTVMQEMALIDLLKELSQKPDSLSLINSAAQFYNVKNQFNKSLEYSMKAFQKDPVNLRALQSIVFSYRGLGNIREVFDYGRRYDLLNPDDIHISYILGEAYMKSLRFKKAIPFFEKVIKADDSYRNAQKLLEVCKEKAKALKAKA